MARLSHLFGSDSDLIKIKSTIINKNGEKVCNYKHYEHYNGHLSNKVCILSIKMSNKLISCRDIIKVASLLLDNKVVILHTIFELKCIIEYTLTHLM